ncbi:MAG TPA: apolipoprotein N-acyltransferase [Pyrinomonadaceae bacterium]|nr:apolipoprotein N-acyltransferase [Pyrinomonadaceae bacterium]
MPEAGAIANRNRSSIYFSLRAAVPTPAAAALAVASAVLTILSFPDFNLAFLAWVGLAPLLLAIVFTRTALRAFILGWLWGTIFFYGTCWWLTYPIIHYAHFRAWLAYPLLLLPVMLVGLFPAVFCSLLSRVIQHFGAAALCVAPLIWISIEWLRYVVTGQLWNALGYSQSFHPVLIQSARFGGVYAVSFILLAMNAAVANLLVRRFRLALVLLAATVLVAVVLSYGSHPFSPIKATPHLEAVILAIQPNVPMDLSGNTAEMNELLERHLLLSRSALEELRTKYSPPVNAIPRLVIWPESPMNFSYTRDPHLREVVENFARTNQTSILLNSLEPAAGGGDQNSALLINEEGGIAARYDKIRLMPFGEYVPLPRWLPGASSVRGLVGEFTPGSSYTLMPLGALRAGVFICIEAAHPSIARTFAHKGADVLINISNDGYLGPTPVMRQHLSNAIFRAVENDRDLVRVTNSGITAYVSSNGQTRDETTGFQSQVRTWTISRRGAETTFYSRHGDIFVYGCALISLGIISAGFMRQKPERKRGQ